MEVETNSSSASTDKMESSQAPVLIISERRRDTPRIRGKKKKAAATDVTDPSRGQPKISTKTFPTILSRIMLKCNSPPALPPNDYLYGIPYTQNLCFLCLEKTAERKRLYHMFMSTSEGLAKDYEEVNIMYRNRADIKIVNTITVGAICASRLYRRVQKHFSDAVWNKQGNVFEMEMIGGKDIWAVASKVQNIHDEEVEQLFNYIKYLSISKS